MRVTMSLTKRFRPNKLLEYRSSSTKAEDTAKQDHAYCVQLVRERDHEGYRKSKCHNEIVYTHVFA